MDGARRSGLAEWSESYPLVATAFIGMGVTVLANWSLGLFIEPMQRDLGWGRGEISAALIVTSAIAFAAAPFAGRLIDRLGTRRVGLPGMALYCAAIALLGTTGSQLWQWWSLWVILAIGYVFVKPTLWATAISKRFDVQRGLALAVTMCGSGALLVFMPVTLNYLIAHHGWRLTYVFLGCGSAALTLPLMFLFLRDRDRPANGSAPQPAPDPARSAEMWAALRSGRFFRLALGALIVTVAIVGLQVHFVPLLTHAGVDRSSAAVIAGMIGVGSIAGRLTCGFLMDRWRGQLVGAVFFALPAISSLFLINYEGGLIAGGAIAGVQGLALGAEMDVIALLAGRYFGLRNYGTLVGTIVGVLVVGAGLGPTLAGTIFDATQSYRLFVMLCIPAFLTASALIASLGDYDRSHRHP